MVKAQIDQGMAELLSRWRSMFEVLANGGEVTPTRRLRTEGLMEALVLLGIADSQQLQAALANCYHEVFGETLNARWGEDWMDLFPFPQIPAFGERAPVYPSSKD